MIITKIMQLGSGAMKGMMGAFPPGPGSIDTSQVRALLVTLQTWDNWLPLHELCQAIGVAVAIWVALQALAAVLKSVEVVKP